MARPQAPNVMVARLPLDVIAVSGGEAHEAHVQGAQGRHDPQRDLGHVAAGAAQRGVELLGAQVLPLGEGLARYPGAREGLGEDRGAVER